MAYSMIPVLTSIFPTDTTITNWCGTTLSYMQEIANILGDGFYAENVSLVDATIHSARSGSNTTITGTIPFLKNPSWNNVGFTFNAEYDSSAPPLYGMVFDFDTNSYVYNLALEVATVGDIQYRNQGLNIINANSSLKMIYGGVLSLVFGGIIFKDNLIISSYTTTHYGGNYYNRIACVYDMVDKRILDTFTPVVRETDYPYMQLAPITYVKGQHVYVLDDVFTMLVAPDAMGNCSIRASYGGTTYAYYGINPSPGGPIYPKFVISNLYSPPDSE